MRDIFLRIGGFCTTDDCWLVEVSDTVSVVCDVGIRWAGATDGLRGEAEADCWDWEGARWGGGKVYISSCGFCF